MNYKRAAVIGIVVYLISMVLGMVICSVLGIQPDLFQPIPKEMWIVSAVLAIFLSIGGAHVYFQDKKIKPSMSEGLQFGTILIVIGFALDFLFFLSLAFENYDPFAVMVSYYSQPPFWITLIMILLGSGVVGNWLEHQKKK